MTISIKKPPTLTFKQRIKIITKILMIAVIFGIPFTSAETDSEREAKLKALRQTMDELRRELESTKGTRDDLLKTLEQAEKKVGNLSKKAKNLDQKLEDRQQKLKDLNQERSQLFENKKEQQQQVGQYINSAYRIGQQSTLRLLLNQEDPAKVSRNMKYYDRIINARSQKIEEFKHVIARINSIEPEIRYEKQLISREVNQLNLQKEGLEKAQSQRKHTLASLEKTIKNQDQQLSSMKVDRKRLEKLLNRVSNYIQDIKLGAKETAFTGMKGKLPWPTRGKLTKRFGSSRVSNKLKWEGWVISSKPGTPVQSVHHGQVVFSDYLRGHGLLVIVDHGKGYLSLYAHNQALYKELGEWVNQGDVIASVGDSGGLQKHALYFELRHKGKPINPKHWLNKSA